MDEKEFNKVMRIAIGNGVSLDDITHSVNANNRYSIDIYTPHQEIADDVEYELIENYFIPLIISH